ncbi:MAG: polysulfide reductase NrfD [Spirochaetes bacterium]|nr:polysulfide reductase NrfD [Spirochaetota bacterium]
MSTVKEFIINEWNSFSRNTKIALAVLGALVFLFIVFGIQILFWGLGYTDMNNKFAMGLWIIGDLGFVALGGGAFFTGFFLYIFRVDKLEPLINSTVLIGFMCYLFTFVLLVFDIGQPLRAWFGYTYPNWGPHLMPQSMLTEVVWCLTLYFCVLCVELIPIPLKHKFLDKIPVLHYIGHYLHRLMWIMAAVGTFLSFFHQGSLGGGMWDVLYAKPQWWRDHHQFFFLAIVGATAGGTCFMIMIPKIVERIWKKEVAPKESFWTLARISGVMFTFYFLFRIYDVYTTAVRYVPLADRRFVDLLGGYYGWWVLVLELLLCIVPIVILNTKKLRENENYLFGAVISGVVAIVLSKVGVVLNGFSIPNFPWSSFAAYNPTIQEWGIMLGSIATMILIYWGFAAYLPLFPHLHKNEHQG